MKQELTTKQAMRYSRQILLSDFDLDKQEILLNCKMLVIGVGGLGCAASQYLAAAGVGTLTLVDDDVVELTNLQRQVLHHESSIGKAKVHSAAITLVQINSETTINVVNTRPDESQLNTLIAEHDLVLDCTDNLASRNLINRCCYRHSTPLISGAAIRMEGQIFSVLPQRQSACYACISHYFGEQNLSCVESGVMSPLVGIIGASQALEAIKVVTQYGKTSENRLQIFDGLSGQWQEIRVPSLPDCAVCGGKG